MKNLASNAPLPPSACTGGCAGCGKIHIKLLGRHDADSRQLHDNLMLALALFPVPYKLLEISEPMAVAATGITALPALILEGQLVVEGRVPAVEEMVASLHDRLLYRSKLHALRHIAVAVDLSPQSAYTLRFAWQLARDKGAELEVLHVMTDFFEREQKSAVRQGNLDRFIAGALAAEGIDDHPAPLPGGPGTTAPAATRLRSRILFGLPDATLANYSTQPDLLVMGTTGQNALTQKIFGSVSTAVSQSARCPVLLVPPQAVYQPWSNLLYASNFESLNDLNIRQAVSFARHFDAQVHFVHVGPAGEKTLELEQKLFEIDYRAAEPERPFIFVHMTGDQVPEALDAYASAHQVGLLIFVTHRRGFWRELLHKSTTRQVAKGGGLPLLVVHADGDLFR